MECPFCGSELVWEDYFGPHIGGGRIRKVGDIYRCHVASGDEEGECEAAGQSAYFHVYLDDGILRHGYPC